jgi:HEAT repeat protein
MTDTITDTLTATVDTYLSMWNERDAARRAAIIRDAWTDDARYVDPMLEASGHAELNAIVEAVQAQFPGQQFCRTTGVDAHHHHVRFGWQLEATDGAVTVAGIDVATVAADGRIQSIVGFFGDLPASH